MLSNPKIKKVFVISVSIIMITVFSFCFSFYGPIAFIKRSWITSSMTSMNHKYLATTIYSKKTIDRIMHENRVEVLNENTDGALINIRYKGNDKIENIEISGKNYTGYLLKIYDPSRLRITAPLDLNSRGQKLEKYVSEHNAAAAINGSGFADGSGHSKAGRPVGMLMVDREIKYSTYGDEYNDIIGITDEGKLILGCFKLSDLVKSEIRDAINFKPQLIINNKEIKIYGDGGWGIAPRSAIGQTEDGVILLLVVDGRQISSYGATMNDIQDIMKEHGAVNAACLDGGSSTIMMQGDKNVNYPCTSRTGRYLPNAIIVN